MTTSCRKRLRGAEDECEECMPISKRINRLHIRLEDQTVVMNDMLGHSSLDMSNMGMVSPLISGPQQMVGPQQMTDTSGCVARPLYPDIEPSSSAHCGCSPHPQLSPLPGTQQLLGPGESGPPNRMPLPDIVQGANPYSVELERYEPDMDSTDNPHYYNINKLLFNVHLERDHRRIGMPPS